MDSGQIGIRYRGEASSGEVHRMGKSTTLLPSSRSNWMAAIMLSLASTPHGAPIRERCEREGIRLGLHTSSSVNVANSRRW